ncbi:MAG: ribosomal-processing cysteine protease Prp [Ruminococcaceae bacterium]|nr:ribosomal-processing cysteine protease Prp [Oscillospiraceae bacterium]
MTKITFFKKDGIYYGFRETGHAGYAESGDDIVCAAISAMTMLVINAIEVSYSSDVDFTMDEATTDIRLIAVAALPEYESDDRKRFAVAGLIEAYYLQLNDMLEDYYDFLDVDEIEEDPENLKK